ncbi:MAG: hypothetical protein IKJ23_06700 [Bacteroidaceae bacterium]|nr:hypothetical protein [Bacteroidaceae bacterium]
MNAAITLIIIGLLVSYILPGFLPKGKNKKASKKNALICKAIGWLLIFLGAYNAISILLEF